MERFNIVDILDVWGNRSSQIVPLGPGPLLTSKDRYRGRVELCSMPEDIYTQKNYLASNDDCVRTDDCIDVR